MKIVLLLVSCLCAIVLCQDTTSGDVIRHRRAIEYKQHLMNVEIPGSFITKTWFIEVKNCFLPHYTYIDILKEVSLEYCAYKCLLMHGCQSFEYAKQKYYCFLSSCNAQTYKARYSFDRDYYQLLKTGEEFIKILGVSIRGHDLKRLHNIDVKDCLRECQTLPDCSMVEYKKEHAKCDLSNVTYSAYPLSVNAFGWDFYQKNPTYCDLKCGPQEWCQVKHSQKICACYPGCVKLPGGNGCYEKPLHKGKTCKCTASGDPHYRTFDGQLIHFMGTCKYTLARSLPSKGCELFKVEVKNENRGNSKVSYTRMVDIILKDVSIRILSRRKIRVNNLDVEAPVVNKKLGYTIGLSNGWIHVETSFQLHVSFDGKHRVRVSVPRDTFGGRLTGICGDCNGHRDDMRTGNGTIVVDKKNRFSLIGESYRVKDDSDKPQLRCEEKEPPILCKENGIKHCEIIHNPRGMFGKCIEKLGATDVREFFESCLFDYCYYANSTNIKSIVCAALESFAAECEVAGVIYNWRYITNCPIKCQANMEYKYKASGCQTTCVNTNPDEDCSRNHMEGCVCKTGFVLSGEDCILPRDCGCSYRGNYIKLGASLTLPGCTQIVVCAKDGTARGQLKIVNVESCVDNSQCITREGIWQCVCNKGFAYNDNKTECEKVPDNPASLKEYCGTVEPVFGSFCFHHQHDLHRYRLNDTELSAANLFINQCNSVCGVEPIDIQLVVDVSRSIREEGLYQTKEFLTEFVNTSVISPNHAQIGILQFNHKVTNKLFLEDSKTQQEVKDAIQTIGPVSSGTRLGNALRFTATSALGRHTIRKYVKRVVIVFTDGQISDVPYVKRWSEVIRRVQKARIVVIGVGRVDEMLLREMTRDGGKVLHVLRFDTLQRVIDDLFRVVCK